VNRRLGVKNRKGRTAQEYFAPHVEDPLARHLRCCAPPRLPAFGTTCLKTRAVSSKYGRYNGGQGIDCGDFWTSRYGTFGVARGPGWFMPSSLCDLRWDLRLPTWFRSLGIIDSGTSEHVEPRYLMCMLLIKPRDSD